MERGRQRICLDEEMHRRERQKMCLDRGGELLEELIAFCNGRSNPIRNFSLNQLQKAIDDCHPLETLKDLKATHMKWYNGILERRRVVIKIFTRCTKEVYRDIVDRVNEVVDPGIRGNGVEGIDQQQQQAFLEVALRCTNPFSREDRPLMIEVAKELQRIERSITAAAP
ncbi:WALL-ASSOCIATED RECEPTOR KINASE-LIKE 21 [Salix purpurea]|uniref:WALL-ASSOCIATED RECEPTOR KINASE-LIKE 21 n=1 Tax=Salix purpurea TaxID=77065 RepID=A0A9Q0PAQ4_SALPP|nr:WALL-ASSOCIATED RECEPTOR KINASE-LIKE 21 [Salix purpurea]